MRQEHTDFDIVIKFYIYHNPKKSLRWLRLKTIIDFKDKNIDELNKFRKLYE